MILACPFCQTRYLVAAGLFVSGPRQVRCARCSHSWRADKPKRIDVVAPPDLSPAPDKPSPVPPGSGLPVVRKPPLPQWLKQVIRIAVAVAAVNIALVLVLYRQDIAKTWPQMNRFYDAVGLHIYRYGEGLSFQQVRSELRYDSGETQLAVEGKVHNATKNSQVIPDILATAIGSDGATMQSWQIDAPAAKVAPGADVPFHSAINAPSGTVAEINLSFVEPKHE